MQRRRGGRGAVAEAQHPQRFLGLRVGVSGFLRPLQAHQHRNVLGGQGVGGLVALVHAVNQRVDFDGFAQGECALDFLGPSGGNQHRPAVFHRLMNGSQGAVIGGPLQPARCRFIDLPRLPVVLGVRKHLLDVGQDSHQRAGKAAEATRGSQVDPQGHRRLDHHLVGPLAGQVDQRGLSGESSLVGGGDRSREAYFAPALQALVPGVELVGGPLPGSGGGAVFRPAGNSGAARLRASPGCGGCCASFGLWGLQAQRGEGVNQPRIDRQPRAVNHPGFRRDGDVGADGFNQPVGNHDGAALNHFPGHRNQAGILNGKVGYLLGCLSLAQRRQPKQQSRQPKRCGRPCSKSRPRAEALQRM